MTRAARAEIDLQALRHNLHRVRRAAPHSRVMAIVKADGYGHGLLRVARALADADAFGVASLDEAVSLREAGIPARIVLLGGFLGLEELHEVCRLQLEPVIHDDAQLTLLERTRLATPLQIWLKVDTGMHRLGFDPAAVAGAVARLQACAWVAESPRLMTHLACADDRLDDMTTGQLRLFEATVAGMPAEQSIANSAAILGWPAAHAQWVRPGIMLYGASPFITGVGADEGLRPVMTLKSRLFAVRHLSKGDRVGYGASWTCPQDMPVGMVGIGYGDGYPRHAAPGAPLLVRGRRVPLVGRVCMDIVCVDLRSCPEACVGDEVVLWGRDLPVEEVAAHASTIAYELLCRLTQRVRLLEV